MSDVAENPPDSAAPPPPDLQQGPLESYPPDGGSPRPSRTPIVIMAVVTAVAVLALASVLVYRFAFPTRPSPSQPVAEAALKGLWLSTEQINAAMGTTEIRVEGTIAGMPDQSAVVPDVACLPLQGAVQARAYEGSGWSVLRAQALQESGSFLDNRWTHHVDQGVVLFSSAQDARAFFTASAREWSACSNRKYRTLTGGPKEGVWSVGTVSDDNGVLSATETITEPVRLSCQRALIVANNVAIDVAAMIRNQPNSEVNIAVNIAKQIASNVPT
jgi:serine/threonine kinase PknH